MLEVVDPVSFVVVPRWHHFFALGCHEHVNKVEGRVTYPAVSLVVLHFALVNSSVGVGQCSLPSKEDEDR